MENSSVVIESLKFESRVESSLPLLESESSQSLSLAMSSRVRVESSMNSSRVESSPQPPSSRVESSHSVYSSHLESVEHIDLQLTYNTRPNKQVICTIAIHADLVTPDPVTGVGNDNCDSSFHLYVNEYQIRKRFVYSFYFVQLIFTLHFS